MKHIVRTLKCIKAVC